MVAINYKNYQMYNNHSKHTLEDKVSHILAYVRQCAQSSGLN